MVARRPAADGGEAFADAISAAQRVSAFCHQNPDADTLAAALAVRHVAVSLGKEAEVIAEGPVMPALRFLSGSGTIRQRPALEPDLAVICDSATLERIGPLAQTERAWFARARLLNIDHHATNTLFGDVNCVDADAAATCQVIAEALPRLRISPDPQLAELLLAGILRDTQGLSETSTSARTLRIAAELVDAGASISTLHRRILSTVPYAALALWGRILNGIESHAGGRIAIATLRLEMLEACGARQHDADGVVELMARVDGADLAVLLREQTDGSLRGSLRATDEIDAAAIAGVFGGGGHRRRAGFTTSGPPAAVRDRIVAIVQDTGGALDAASRTMAGRTI